MLALSRKVSGKGFSIVRAFSDTQKIYDRGIVFFQSLLYVESVISHRNVLAKRKDIKDYSYLRDDIIEQLTDRLLVEYIPNM